MSEENATDVTTAADESQDGSMDTFAEGHLLTKVVMEWFYSLYQPKSGDQRAFPPSDRDIIVDPDRREVVPYRLA